MNNDVRILYIKTLKQYTIKHNKYSEKSDGTRSNQLL